MLIEELKDQWICSCGNWVDREFTWCPDCCEYQGGHTAGELEWPHGSSVH